MGNRCHNERVTPRAGLKFAFIVKLNPDSLATHLEQKLLPVYLVSGDEPLLTGEAADAVRARARAAGFTEREAHFLERGSDWDDVRASAGNLSPEARSSSVSAEPA